jgi:hypothetical protein
LVTWNAVCAGAAGVHQGQQAVLLQQAFTCVAAVLQKGLAALLQVGAPALRRAAAASHATRPALLYCCPPQPGC